MPLKKDDAARVIQPTIEGVVTKIKYDEDTGDRKLLLSWNDANGEAQERWFVDAELEAVPA